jgi:hypothetical protein
MKIRKKRFRNQARGCYDKVVQKALMEYLEFSK